MLRRLYAVLIENIFPHQPSITYKAFVSIMDSVNWSKEHLSVLHTSEDSFIQLARDAKHPFQFIANVLSLEGNMDPTTIPVTQDALSSAYQIMSYLLLDVDLAMRTSLIPSEDDLIKDVCSFFR